MTLLLSDRDVDALLTMEDTLGAVEEMFRRYALGEASNLPRRYLQAPQGYLAVMGGAAHYLGVFGVKVYSVVQGGMRFHIYLYSMATGELLAVMEANRMGQLRTGAITGVAARYMSRPDATTLGIIGTGFQAPTQVEAVSRVRDIRLVKAFSPNPQRRAAFAREVGGRLGIEVVAVESSREVVEGSDIVICITTARGPVFDGHWLSPGAFVISAGPNTFRVQEVDETTIQRSGVIVVDCLEQAPRESGELAWPVERGVLRWGQVRELKEVVAGRFPGRTSPEEITFFKSMGIGLADVCTAKVVYDLARGRGMGREVPL
jgi:ornithine cyclodeaminase/alanine dehydrogenase-like protein (mu-crystallin family)